MARYCELSLQAIAVNGVITAGCVLEFFDAGTTTRRTVYKDAAAAAAHPAQITTNASGRVPQVYISGTTPLRCRITAPSGVLVEDIDGIPGETASSGGGGSGGGSAGWETGDIKKAYDTAQKAGWVRMNGRTIGSVSSGATERANADCQALFEHLWNKDASLAVVGGRGLDSASDWLANKQIALPDARFRALVGLDTMGAGAAGRSTGATFGTGGNATTLGSVGGQAGETLLITHLPAHAHTGSTSQDGQHQHTGTSSADGGHSHTATTASAGLHQHGGAVQAGGGHAHTGSTDTQGLHYHNTPAPGVKNATAGSGSTATALWSGDAGNAATTDSQGSHAHNVTTDTAPNHVHGIVADGAHTHTVTVTAVAAHTHTVTVDLGGLHGHTFTTDLVGGGTAHNNMGPFLLVTFYLKL